jgi:hypothetical protein
MANLLHAIAERRVRDAAIDYTCGDLDDAHAFRRLIQSVRFLLSLQFRAPTADARLLVPFGPRRGQPLASLPLAELEQLEAWLRRALEDPARASWRRANRRLLAALADERARRAAAC